MPREVEQKLRQEGTAMGLAGRRLDSYVYGKLREQGWLPPKELGSGYHKKRVHR